jgi:hypothetical protein
MRKGILSVVCLLFLVGWAQAQVIATFEAGDEGFTDLAWASPNGLTGLSVVTDPNLAGNHVLQATFDRSAGQRATISFSPKATMAQVVMFYIWLPTDTPDSLQIETFAQDNSHWSHTEGGWIYAKDIPKGVWCPLNFYIKQGQ